MQRTQRGLTLVELVVVVALIGLLAAFSVGRIDSIDIWKQKGDIRKFVDTLEFLVAESVIKKHAYRVVIDLDDNSYYVRREIRTKNNVKNVDYLKNLRLKSETERLKKKEEEELLSLEEEFKEEDLRATEPLETTFYEYMFSDAEATHRLAIPLEFPELGKKKEFSEGLRIRDIETARGKISKGEFSLRYSTMMSGVLAVIHFQAGSHLFSARINPAAGNVVVEDGDISFEKAFTKFKELSQ